MSKAKLMNELTKRYVEFIGNSDNKEANAKFLGFFDACKIVLTEEQMLSAMEQGNKRFELK